MFNKMLVGFLKSCFLVFLPCNVLGQILQTDSMSFYFPFNGYSVTASDSEKIVSFINKYKFSNSTTIDVSGYTDTAGSTKYNRALSSKRCQSVNAVLQPLLLHPGNIPVRLSAMGEDKESLLPDSLQRRVVLLVRTIKRDSGKNSIAKPVAAEKVNLLPKENRVVDTVIVLDYIYFEPDKPILSGASIQAIPHYVSILKKYRNNDMEVAGHVNYNDSRLRENDPLFKLSEQRAKEIYSFLIDNGFSQEKLSYKGYGNWRPLFPEPVSVEEKRKNMRVEVVVFKIQ